MSTTSSNGARVNIFIIIRMFLFRKLCFCGVVEFLFVKTLQSTSGANSFLFIDKIRLPFIHNTFFLWSCLYLFRSVSFIKFVKILV